MKKSNKYLRKKTALICLLWLLILAKGFAATGEGGGNIMTDMILIKGGTFTMGDVFGDGAEDERPLHQVTLDDFYLCKYEVTVAEFRTFVDETGYATSAEGPDDPDARRKIAERFSSSEITDEERRALHKKYLRYSGAGFWDADMRKWIGYNPLTNWKNPGIAQTDKHPVLAISPDDAMHYCNWLSKKAGLPVAYDLETGDLLDKNGRPTSDVTAVIGFRLPTEAEWEYAAREGGREVRFGNSQNIARSSEINFRGDEGEYEYLEMGRYIGRTTPVGSYGPNSLGLYDMSGNAWEWVGDRYADYPGQPQVNPIVTSGDRYVTRGGRWGGDAFEIRVFHRDAYPRNDRCNNTGFRIARSK